MSYHDSHDLFRHTPLRYLGYANEIGEAFRYQISTKALVFSYIVSTTYVLADTVDKSYKSYKIRKNKEDNKTNDQSTMTKELIRNSFLSLSWQLLATEFIPGGFVFVVVRIAKKYKYSFIKSQKIRFWIPTALGLVWIPCFPHTIDPLVDAMFDKLNLDIDLH